MTRYELRRLIMKRLLVNIEQMIGLLLYALPIAILIALITFILIKYYEKKKIYVLKKAKKIAIVLMTMYVSVLAQTAILFRPFGTKFEIDIIPFNTKGGFMYIILYAAANALIFIPVGILLPVIWERMRNLRNCAIAGFVGSVFIEVTQLILKCGVFQIEDMIMNTAGAVFGGMIFCTVINKRL